MINSMQIKGNWNKLKGKLRQMFGQIAENDLIYERGRGVEMMGNLQVRLGKTKVKLFKIISGISKKK
jgi:uncharacterized protein YjbJ (UPF0337 family)